MDATRSARSLRRTLAVGGATALVTAGLAVAPLPVGPPARASAPALSAPATAVQAVTYGNTDSEIVRYIELVYGDLFGRLPDPTGLADWTGRLDHGTPRVAVANAITGSTEYRARLIAGAYERYLHRGPDAVGLAGWLDAMARGWTVAQIEAGFIGSAEYYQRAGGTDAAWVTLLYGDVLHRTPAASEAAAWTGVLAAGASRARVSTGFLLSTEHLAAVVAGHYQHLLGRGLDPTGSAGWVAMLQQGGRDEVLIAGIVGSEEYWARATAPGQLEVLPVSGSIASGAALTFQVLSYTTMGQLLGDVGWQARLTVDGDAGACVATTCSVVEVGDHAVTATVGRASRTVNLQVREATGPVRYSLWTWGSGTWGTFGDATLAARTDPARVGLETHWASVAAGFLHLAGLKTDGTLWTWGDNRHGQIGDGTTTDRVAPVQVGAGKQWTAVSVGDTHTVALAANGTLWTWGGNTSGQLGDGTRIARSSPVPVSPGRTWVAAAAGRHHTVAVASDGTLWTWGATEAGDLALGDPSDMLAPTQVGTDAGWSSVAAGTISAAIRTDGTLWTWGPNGSGQLGDGTTTPRTSPTQVGTASTWTQVSTWGDHVAALQADGSLWTWGSNARYELGDGTQAPRSTPAQVAPGTAWSAVAVDSSHTLAVRSDGTLWRWGWPPVMTSPLTTPTQVGTDAGWVSVVAAPGSAAALRP